MIYLETRLHFPLIIKLLLITWFSRAIGNVGIWLGLELSTGTSSSSGLYSDSMGFDCNNDYHDLQECPINVVADTNCLA